jgi:hypothetical protein
MSKALLKDLDKSEVILELSQRINDYLILNTMSEKFPLTEYITRKSLKNGNIEIMYHDYTLGNNDIKAYDTNSSSFDGMFKAGLEPAYRELYQTDIHWYKKLKTLGTIYNNVQTDDSAFNTLFNQTKTIYRAKEHEISTRIIESLNKSDNYDQKLEFTKDGSTAEEKVKSVLRQLRSKLIEWKTTSRNILTRKPFNVDESGNKVEAPTPLEYSINGKNLKIFVEKDFYVRYQDLISNTFNKELIEWDTNLFVPISFKSLTDMLDAKKLATSKDKNKFTYTKDILDPSKNIMFGFDLNWINMYDWYEGAVMTQTQYPNILIHHEYHNFDFIFRKDALAFYVQPQGGTEFIDDVPPAGSEKSENTPAE